MPVIPHINTPTLFFLLKLKKNPFAYYRQLQKQYGDIFYKKIFQQQNYFLINPPAIEHVLHTNQDNYRKHFHVAKMLEPFFGMDNIVFNNDLPQWHRDRMLAKTVLDPDVFFNNHATIVTRECDNLLNSWNQKTVSGAAAISFQFDIDNLFLSISNETLFYQLDFDAKELARIGPKFLYAIIKKQNSFAKFLWTLPTKERRTHRSLIRYAEQFKSRVMSSRLNTHKEYDDLAGALIHHYDVKNEESPGFKHVANNIFFLLVASYFTTASTLGWALRLLAAHPEIEKQVYAEATAVCNGNSPTYADVPKLKYLQAVLLETLRLYPPIHRLPREAIESDEINGSPIPADSGIFILTYFLHRHPDYWTDPEKFNPDRFLTKPSGQDCQYAYLPFGSGKRACIGRNFSLVELSLTMAMIVQRFQFSQITSHDLAIDQSRFFLRPLENNILIKRRS
jgi:cytochrome P450